METSRFVLAGTAFVNALWPCATCPAQDADKLQRYAEIRARVEKQLDKRTSYMPFECQDVESTNVMAMRYFVRGCNLMGLYDPRDNIISEGLSPEEMLQGIERAISEFEKALKTHPTFAPAQKQLDTCRSIRNSHHFRWVTPQAE